MTKIPSPECWRGFVEVMEVDDEGSFSRMLERYVEVIGVDDEGFFSRMLERVR